MNLGSRSNVRTRTPPAGVRRALRREVGFGCPVCGDPLLTYHHIVPWRQEAHFRVADMLALCDKHHRQADSGAIAVAELYRLKSAGSLRHVVSDSFVIRDWSKFTIELGQVCEFVNCHSVLRIEDEIVIGFSQISGKLALYLHITDDKGQSLLLIDDGDWLVNVNRAWDCEVKANRIHVRGEGGYYANFWWNAELERVTIGFRLRSNGVDFAASRTGFVLGGINHVWKNFRFVNAPVAFDVYKKKDGRWGLTLGSGRTKFSLQSGESRMTSVYLTKHEGARFEGQTIYVSGNAYIGCSFHRCTLIITTALLQLHDCEFRNCNWHLDILVLWGDTGARSVVRELLDLMDGSNASIMDDKVATEVPPGSDKSENTETSCESPP